jgi:hypothetical protein
MLDILAGFGWILALVVVAMIIVIVKGRRG